MHRPARFHPIAVLALLPLLVSLFCALPASPALCAQAKKAAAEPEPAGEPVEISGRIAAGLDKVFIKDAEGYILVQGLDLSPYAGRNIAAKGLVIRREQEYRVVRLLEYRLQSPDDDSPGAAGQAPPKGAAKAGAATAAGQGKKK